MITKIQMRRGAAADWAAANPVLAAGEPGYETDTGKFKIGNGANAWTALPYASGLPTAEDGKVLAWSGAQLVSRPLPPHQGRKLIPVFDKAVVVPSTPEVMLIDEVVDLKPYGALAWSKQVLLQCQIERQDENGEWVPCEGSDYAFRIDQGGTPIPGYTPRADASRGYDVCYGWFTSPLSGEAPNLGDISNEMVAGGTHVPYIMNQDDHGGDPCAWFPDNPGGGAYGLTRVPDAPYDQDYKLRLTAARTTRVYTSEEQAAIDAEGPRRIHITAHVQDLCVWEIEVPIPAADGVHVLPQLNDDGGPGVSVDLAALGITTDQDRMAVVAEVRRNGKSIQPDEADGVPPVRIVGRVHQPSRPWDRSQNGESLALSGVLERGSLAPNADGSWAYCTHNIQTRLRFLAWRDGASAVPATGCTLRIRILAAPHWWIEDGMFRGGDTEKRLVRFRAGLDIVSSDAGGDGNWRLRVNGRALAFTDEIPPP